MSNENNKKTSKKKHGKYMNSIVVGPKGQIVIPKEAREMFDINPGDTLLLLADINRGITVHRLDFFDKVADEIFLRADNDPQESKEKEDGLNFANAVKEMYKPDEEKK